jgi:4-amino-4-deoxy-L-arabinose transferase-like glycosyltransferase
VKRLQTWATVTLILLVGATLRFWGLGEVPPGLAHDEVANWLIARDILAGEHAIYFTAAYGHEPLYQYLQAGTVALFGDHWLGLRYPSAALGLLGLAAMATLVRRLAGTKTALAVMAFAAVSFWPLFYARVGLRAILLPFTGALAAYFLCRGLGLSARSRDVQVASGQRTADWLLAGLLLGISLYTYMASRILPVIVLAFMIYVSLVRRSARKYWPGMVLVLVIAALVFAPLGLWLARNPEAEYRIAEVRQPLDRLLAGDPSLVWHNLGANLGFFVLSGDRWPRQNVPGRPVFADPVGAVLFCIGLGIAIWRWRDPRYGFLVIWMLGSLVPSVITADAPSSIRNILALVVTFVFPALAWEWLAGLWSRAGPARRWLSIRAWRVTSWSVLAAALVLGCGLSVRDYFIRWPAHEVVQFDYQSDLTAVAEQVGRLPLETPVAVAGLSVYTMDRYTLSLSTRRDVGSVRLSDTRETLLVPAGDGARLFVPQVVPLDPVFERLLLTLGAVVESDPSYVGYRLPDRASLESYLQGLDSTAAMPDGASVPLPVSFGGQLAFLGYEPIPAVGASEQVVLTFWRVAETPREPLRIFLHALGESGTPIAQDDGLASAPWAWETGDVLVQKHELRLPAGTAPGKYRLQVGVYDPATGTRLAVSTADRLLLGWLTVAE